MNKSYLIVPAILLAIFGFLYSGALKEMKTKEDARIAKIEKETKEKEAAANKTVRGSHAPGTRMLIIPTSRLLKLF